MMDSHFEVQLTAVLDVLMKSAVTDICALVESWFKSVQIEISRSKKENEDLRQKLHIIQQQHEHQQQQAAAEADLERKSTKVEEPDCEVRDTDEWNGQLIGDASGAPEMSSPNSTLLNQSASNVNAGLQSWVRMFQVPWDRMPPQISEAISTGQRAQPGARREMVRIVVAAMQEYCPNPNRAACAEVARVIVSEYPLTFADMTEEGEQLGSGYHSLLNQLKTRVENVNRSNVSYRIRQPRRPERESDDDSSAPKKIRSKVDSYGCINWQPNNLPEGENPISLESKRKIMTDLFQCAGPKAVDLTEVGDLMSTTYVYQRHMINACPPHTISEIQEQWPFLFTKTGLCNHFQILTGIDISSRLSDALISKGRRIINFFQSQRMKWDRDIQSLLRETEGVSNNMISISAILLVMKYFQEKEDALFISADTTATKMLMEEEGTLPVTPRLIMLGDTLLSSTKWMVSIEGKVTHIIDTHLDFAAALAVLFGCFYVFNIEYQESACATLELIQRFFVRINPEGTKCTAKSGVSRRTGSFVKRKPTAFNPRVHAFLQRLTEFEWKTSI